MSALLAAALDYAVKRLPVFPGVPNGKLPAISARLSRRDHKP